VCMLEQNIIYIVTDNQLNCLKCGEWKLAVILILLKVIDILYTCVQITWIQGNPFKKLWNRLANLNFKYMRVLKDIWIGFRIQMFNF